MGCSMIINCNDNDNDNDNEKSVLNVCRTKLSSGAPGLYWISRRKITLQCSRLNFFHRLPEIVNGRTSSGTGVNKIWIGPDNINSCILISLNEESGYE